MAIVALVNSIFLKLNLKYLKKMIKLQLFYGVQVLAFKHSPYNKICLTHYNLFLYCLINELIN